MLTCNNVVMDHPRSEESIRLIQEHLVKVFVDGDGDSLLCRFGEILHRIEDQQVSARGTWNYLIKTLEELKQQKELVSKLTSELEAAKLSKAAADKVMLAIDRQVRNGSLDSRSAIADARLDYGDPFPEETTKDNV